MVATAKIAVFDRLSKRNREWLEDDFFGRAPTRAAVLGLAEHYCDIAATNTACTKKDRAEYSRRAKYLKRLAAGL